MNEDNHTPALAHPSPEALFRYTVLSQVIARELGGEPRAKAIAAVVAQAHTTPAGTLRSVTARSLYRWLASYQALGYEGLLRSPRTPLCGSLVLDERLVAFFKDQKRDDPHTSVPELIRRARQVQLIEPQQRVDRTTVWRALKRSGVDTRRRHAPKADDCRRFSYPHRLDMVLCDGKHFRVGPTKNRRVALFFLDDATRYGLAVVVGTSENTALFLRGLYQCVLAYGPMSILYLDNGPGFIALDALEVLRHLKVHFIHGTARYPEGHGKIERFNQTAWTQLLRLLTRPEVDPECAALELRLQHFLCEQYNHQPHESLAKDTPYARFHQDPKPLTFAESRQALRETFVVHLKRKASPDHVISLDGVLYEVPRGLARTEVLLYRNLLDASVRCLHQGRLVRLSPLDPVANARARRARPSPEAPTVAVPPKSSAELAFEHELGPVVGADGGFPTPNQETDDE
jgi:transposase InsO family protein